MEMYFFADFAPTHQNPCKGYHNDANLQTMTTDICKKSQTWGGPRTEATYLASLSESEPGVLGCVQREYLLAEGWSITAQIPRDIWGCEVVTHRSAGLLLIDYTDVQHSHQGSCSDSSETRALRGSFGTRKQNQRELHPCSSQKNIVSRQMRLSPKAGW